MKITHPLSPKFMHPPTHDTFELESFFRSMKDHQVDLVVVVIPNKGNSYGKGQIVLIKYSSMLVSVLFLILAVWFNFTFMDRQL
jgi:hypothetical protein